jgi:hypothetical protein
LPLPPSTAADPVLLELKARIPKYQLDAAADRHARAGARVLFQVRAAAMGDGVHAGSNIHTGELPVREPAPPAMNSVLVDASYDSPSPQSSDGVVWSSGHDRRTARRLSRPLEQAHVLLCLAGALMMLIVGESLPRAFGIAGAAAIIRFRTAHRGPAAESSPCCSADGARDGKPASACDHRRRRHGCSSAYAFCCFAQPDGSWSAIP